MFRSLPEYSIRSEKMGCSPAFAVGIRILGQAPGLSRNILFFVFALVFTGMSPVAGAQLEVSGYYKNLLVGSRTLALFPPDRQYWLDLNRLRLQVKGRVGGRLAVDVQYDNELILGDFLDTAQFAALKAMELDSRFDLDNTYADTSDLYGRQRVYRAYATVAFAATDLRIGRQRIAWGTALLWNPMDILNPFDPIQLEREERAGVDAVLFDWNYSALSRLSLVHARQRSGASTAMRWRGNRAGFDLSFMAGRFRGDTVAGFDYAGQIGQIGVRGEFTRTDSAREGSYTRAVFGADYTFANTLSLNVELYHNGQGATGRSGYDFDRLLAGEIQSLARNYVGGYLGYDITPLLRWDSYLIVNLDDSSKFFTPGLAYSLSDNLEWTVGAQIFGGDTGSEYGALENLYYTQLQWFF